MIRGGYGVTVSPVPFSRPLRGFYPLVISNSFVSESDYVPYGSFATGIPLFYGPDMSSGVVDLPLTAWMGSTYANEVNRGYIQSWNLTYERRLPWDMSVSAGYVGTLTTNQLGFRDINASGAGEGQAGQPLYQQWGRTGTTYRFDGWLDSNYHSLQVALNKPFSKGFFVKAAYTFSKAMNRTDDEGWSNVSWNSDDLLYKNYGPAGFDRTHMFQLGFLAELPFGKKGSGVGSAIVKNWSLNGLFSAFTGTPFTVSASGASVNARANAQTADLVGTPNKTGDIGADTPYYDPSCVGADHGGSLRQHGPQHGARARMVEHRPVALPRVPHREEGQPGGARRGLQPDQHAALPEPQRERQLGGIHDDHRDGRSRWRRRA